MYLNVLFLLAQYIHLVVLSEDIWLCDKSDWVILMYSFCLLLVGILTKVSRGPSWLEILGHGQWHAFERHTTLTQPQGWWNPLQRCQSLIPLAWTWSGDRNIMSELIPTCPWRLSAGCFVSGSGAHCYDGSQSVCWHGGMECYTLSCCSCRRNVFQWLCKEMPQDFLCQRYIKRGVTKEFFEFSRERIAWACSGLLALYKDRVEHTYNTCLKHCDF